jgi:hypothetical protein
MALRNPEATSMPQEHSGNSWSLRSICYLGVTSTHWDTRGSLAPKSYYSVSKSIRANLKSRGTLGNWSHFGVIELIETTLLRVIPVFRDESGASKLFWRLGVTPVLWSYSGSLYHLKPLRCRGLTEDHLLFGSSFDFFCL